MFRLVLVRATCIGRPPTGVGPSTPRHECAQPDASFLVTRRATLAIVEEGDNEGKDAFQFDIVVLSTGDARPVQ